MNKYIFYEYIVDQDKIKIYSDDIQRYFDENFNIKINTVDFDENKNVILYINYIKITKPSNEIEKIILNEIEHLNDIEIKNMNIVMIFDAKNIEIF